MNGDLRAGGDRAEELLALRDGLDVLDDEIRVRDIGFLAGPLIAGLLVSPVIIALVTFRPPFSAAYVATLLVVGAVILAGMAIERHRLSRKRKEVRERIYEIEESR